MTFVRQIGAATSEAELLQLAANALKERFSAEVDILTATNSGLLLVASTHAIEAEGRLQIGKGVGLVGQVYSSNRPIAVAENVQANENWALSPNNMDAEFESAVAVPMPGEKAPIGALIFLRPERWDSAAMIIPACEEAASELAGALTLFRTAYEQGVNSSRMAAVSEVTRSISASPYLEEILQLLVHMTAQRFKYKVVTVRLLDDKRQELILRATQATNKAYQNKRAIHLGESIAGRVLKQGHHIIVRDVQNDPDYVGHDLAKEQGLRSLICLPLSIQGRSVGVLTCYTGETRDFSEDEIDALETLTKQAAVSIEHAKLQVRSTLMQEMHHRVKNNLQQVASLLRLQIRQSHYKDPEQALTDSLSRILAIASVHELLSRDDLDHVSMKELAETLGAHIQQSMVMPGKQIGFSIRGDEVYLNTNQATQVALIMNEMIQNAIEHGFEIKNAGEIHLTIEERNGDIGLWVSNDGDPLPEGFDVEKGRLGLQIILSLVRALGGQFKIDTRLGWTVFEVKFTRTRAE